MRALACVGCVAQTSKMYSKGRKGKGGSFSGDSKQKEASASGLVKSAAETYLYPVYEECLGEAKAHDLAHPFAAV